ncbi:MAG: sigma-54-dependent Fis family transcriptional regulator [Nitrospirae bacterium]|nr:MAG: sigma-54-dependent Fis family transcriptional regulator [Nitrospirota bacterium]
MRALILDDEANIRKVLKTLLAESGFKAHEAANIQEAHELIAGHFFDLAFMDMRLPDGSGLDTLKEIKASNPETKVLVITAFASTETAIEAMKAGAYDYVIKPFNIDEIRVVIKNIKETIQLHQRIRLLETYTDGFEGIVGKSEAMKKVYMLIEKIAPFDTSVLIFGESGTGKELVSRAIHNRSLRSEQPFITINCASLPAELLESELFGYTKGSFTGAYTSKRGLIDEANNGTLFLDEIGEMPLSLQAKLLRFLEDKKVRPIGGSSEIDVDVRIIAASNKDLRNEGIFRGDLYFRLSTFEISLPTLDDRKEDIPLLVEHFVKALSKKFQKTIKTIDPVLIDFLTNQKLRGNVRELKNLIEREIILSEEGILRLTHYQPPQKNEPSLTEIPDNGFDIIEYMAKIEQTLFSQALQKANGVKTKAAELLGLSFREFRYRLSKHGKK